MKSFTTNQIDDFLIWLESQPFDGCGKFETTAYKAETVINYWALMVDTYGKGDTCVPRDISRDFVNACFTEIGRAIKGFGPSHILWNSLPNINDVMELSDQEVGELAIFEPDAD